MTIRRLLGTSLLAVAATGALYGTASAAPAFIDTGSASGSSETGTPCNDGTVSPSHGSGTCSHHGGELKNQGHVHHGDGYGGHYHHHR